MAPPLSALAEHPINDFTDDVTAQMDGFNQSQHIAEEAIARDLEDDTSTSEDDNNDDDTLSSSSTIRQFSTMNSYRRPSYVNTGARSTAMISSSVPELSYISASWTKHSRLSKKERETVRDDERSLLRDKNLLPPKHPHSGSVRPSNRRSSKVSFSGLRKVKSLPDEESAVDTQSSERAALLGGSGGDPNLPNGGFGTPQTINQKWNEAVAAGKINTSWRREAMVLAKSSAPMILTFCCSTVCQLRVFSPSAILVKPNLELSVWQA
jgi:MATE family multidrug resistance protein